MPTTFDPWTSRDGDPPSRDRARMLLWVVLGVAAVVPIFVVRVPPLYDYPNWVFQGRIVADLLSVGPDPSSAVNPHYALNWRPIPNLAAPLGIAMLSAFLPSGLAGRVFLSLCVLLFGYAYAYLVRSIQRGPTAMEFFGIPWAFGYFFYKGYVSYFVSLPLAFFAIGKMHRMSTRTSPEPTGREVALLTGLSALLYLSHLLGWIVFVVALVVYSTALARRGVRAGAIKLLSTAIPSVAMLAVYTTLRVQEHNATTVTYRHLLFSRDKVISLIEPLLLFLRADPFSPLVLTFWVNAAALVMLAAVAVTNIDWRASPARLPAIIGALLGMCALFLPFANFGDLNRPDERFVLPAVLITVAALRFKCFDARRGAATAFVIMLILAQHFVEDMRVSRLSERISDATLAVIPPDARVLTLTIHDGPISGGCASTAAFPSIGAPTLRWLDIRRLEVTTVRRVSLLDTSLLREKPSEGEAGITAEVMTVDDIRSQPALGERLVKTYPYVELFGCEQEVAEAQAKLDSEYRVVGSGRYFRVLADREMPAPGTSSGASPGGHAP